MAAPTLRYLWVFCISFFSSFVKCVKLFKKLFIKLFVKLCWRFYFLCREGYRRLQADQALLHFQIFKLHFAKYQKFELPSEAGATNFISSENSVVSEETTTEKVNSSSSQRPSTLFPQSTPFIFVPPPLISPISSPIFVPPHIISPLSSPFFGFPPS
jgi:hypothetical protein